MPSAKFMIQAIAVYVQIPNMHLKYHLYAHIANYFRFRYEITIVSIYASYELTAINNVTGSPCSHILILLAYTLRKYSSHSTYMSY